MSFLTENEIEAILEKTEKVRKFFDGQNPMVIFRNRPLKEDPLYEVQLAWDMGDRHETFCWLWVDALRGEVVKKFPE